MLAAAWVVLLLSPKALGGPGVVSDLIERAAPALSPAAGDHAIRGAAPPPTPDLLALDATDALDLEEEKEDADGCADARVALVARPPDPGPQAPAGVVDTIPARSAHAEPEARAPPTL